MYIFRGNVEKRTWVVRVAWGVEKFPTRIQAEKFIEKLKLLDVEILIFYEEFEPETWIVCYKDTRLVFGSFLEALKWLRDEMDKDRRSEVRRELFEALRKALEEKRQEEERQEIEERRQATEKFLRQLSEQFSVLLDRRDTFRP